MTTGKILPIRWKNKNEGILLVPFINRDVHFEFSSENREGAVQVISAQYDHIIDLQSANRFVGWCGENARKYLFAITMLAEKGDAQLIARTLDGLDAGPQTL